MTEPEAPAALPAGALLRAAREARGLHVANLAVALKVPPRKIEALEADQWGELGDPVFVRALAQAVCRQLKVDPQPVLQALPRPDRDPVQAFADSPVTGRAPVDLRTATRARRAAGAVPVALPATSARRPPAAIVAGVILLAAGALYVWTGSPQETARELPARSVSTASASSEPARSDSSAAEPAVAASGPPLGTWPVAAAPVPAPEPPRAASATVPAVSAGGGGVSSSGPAPGGVFMPPGPAASSAPSAAGSAPVIVTVSADSWVQVRDARGELPLSRLLRAGERVELSVVVPAQVVVGNVAGTALALRGAAVDLAPYSRDNVARTELR